MPLLLSQKYQCNPEIEPISDSDIMLNFLRKLRRNNLNTKYLKYAIGEIFLVVIGILIALAINNWNEGRKSEEQLLTILREIRNDIKGDLPRYRQIFKNGKEDDSLATIILNREYNLDTLSNTEKRSLFFTGLSYQPYEYSTFGFEKLQAIVNTIPDKYDEIVELLNHQYSTLGPIAQSTYEQEATYVAEKHNFLALNMPWYRDFRDGNITPEVERFFTEGFIYENWLAQFSRDNSAKKNSFNYEYVRSSLASLVAINELLGIKEDLKFDFLIPAYTQSVSEFEGTYLNQSTNSKYEISLRGDFLIVEKALLNEVAKDEFEGFFGTKFKFNRDASSQVVSLNIYRQGLTETAIKQE